MVNTEVLRKIAAAAAIRLDDDVIPEYTEYLNSLLDYIQRIESFDVEEQICEIEGTSPVDPQDCREDAIKDLLSPEEFLANAPDRLGGMVKVPVVIK